ncbi:MULTISPECIES: MarR family winged helix-turn-helix transcriptional regulator [Clostridium]|uniref:Winged helix-turn-helix transcriptional regulator n=1 Tax=Clostridium cibarium TaxID=2762247 RepID=A0ABR8PX45_9CLOT|nr:MULTISPECIES: MarR family winged helix-turn-helix transcriptional regulator [Clostridium]MBD7912755.1 winged helix-turn-helix transcriptional regulator [Clostridium cibarium]
MNIGYELNLCSKLVKKRLNKELEPYELTSVQFCVLKYMDIHSEDNNFSTAVNIAEMLDMDKPTVSAVVNRLIEKGYIRKSPHPTDGRAWVLSLTNRYRNNSDIFECISEKIMRSATVGMDEDEISFMQSTMSKIISNLKNEV